MSADQRLRETMLKNRLEQAEELEKHIVMTTLQLEDLAGPNGDIRATGMLRKRRDTIEAEYERLKDEISELRAGRIPKQREDVEEMLQKARYNLRKTKEQAKKLKDKVSEADEYLFDPNVRNPDVDPETGEEINPNDDDEYFNLY